MCYFFNPVSLPKKSRNGMIDVLYASHRKPCQYDSQLSRKRASTETSVGYTHLSEKKTFGVRRLLPCYKSELWSRCPIMRRSKIGKPVLCMPCKPPPARKTIAFDTNRRWGAPPLCAVPLKHKSARQVLAMTPANCYPHISPCKGRWCT